MVFAMIVVGGVTRVTRSGLSITTWDPVVGTLPPLSHAAWDEAFTRYRASPEGMHVNAGIGVDDFRSLYLVEYFHRLLGRVAAVVLVVPLVFFARCRAIAPERVRALVVVLGAGVTQGFIGWYMVSSGLVDQPHVSPFRLALHLAFGVALLGSFVWIAMADLPREPPPRGVRGSTLIALLLTTLGVVFGALMAGYHAGLFCSTFPTMNGDWVPPALSMRGIVTDAWTVHFVHRLLALLVTVSVVVVGIRWRRGSKRQRWVAGASMACVGIQVTLGALLVMGHVPPGVAVVHQATAAILVTLLVALLREATWRPAHVRVERAITRQRSSSVHVTSII